MLQFFLVSPCCHYLVSEFHRHGVIFQPSLVRHHLAVEKEKIVAFLFHARCVSEIHHMSLDSRHENQVAAVAGNYHSGKIRELRITVDIFYQRKHILRRK